MGAGVNSTSPVGLPELSLTICQVPSGLPSSVKVLTLSTRFGLSTLPGLLGSINLMVSGFTVPSLLVALIVTGCPGLPALTSGLVMLGLLS